MTRIARVGGIDLHSCTRFVNVACAHLLIILLLVASTPSLAGAAGSAIGKTTESDFLAIADSHVESILPDRNYGDAALLLAAKSEDEHVRTYVSYIMFDLSPIPAGSVIVLGRLELYLEYMSGKAPTLRPYISISAHYCPDNSWSEHGITWNNKPNFVEKPTDSWGLSWVPGGTFAEVAHFSITNDAQTALTTGGRLTMVIAWGEGLSGSATFGSREPTSPRDPPKLVVIYIAPPFKFVKFESLQDTGESENLGYVCVHQASEDVVKQSDKDVEAAICSFAVVFPQEVNANPTDYTIAYVRGYSFLRWETLGDVSVKGANDRVTTLTVKGDGTVKGIGSSKLIEYGYDELDLYRGHGRISGHGGSFFVRFTPTFSGYLRTARFYFSLLSENATKNEVKVRVLDENRHDVVAPISVRAISQDSWLDVDLTGYNVAVFKGIDFYVGLQTTFGPWLGVDYGNPDGKSWIVDSSWQPGEGDYMIRAVVERAEVQRTTAATPMTPTILTALGLVIFIAAMAAVAIFFVRRKGTRIGRPSPPAVTARPAGVKYCVQCGELIPEAAVYCPTCASKQQ